MKRKIAVILAAGKGTRLGQEGLSRPKTMTRVENVRIIDNLMLSLIRNGFKEAVVVVGYLEQKLRDGLKRFQSLIRVRFVVNPVYESTNNIYSLWLARRYCHDGFYLFESDVFFEPPLLRKLVECKHPNVMLVDRWRREMNGTVVELKEHDYVKEMYLKTQQGEGFDFEGKFKTVNFYKLSSKYVRDSFLVKLDRHIRRKDVNIYYEQIIKEDVDDGHSFFGLKAGAGRWWEIDTPEDVRLANRIFG